MRIGLGIVVAVLGALAEGPAVAASCPVGSILMMDSQGVYRCQPSKPGPMSAAQASNGGCPGGSRPWTDFWGREICRSSEAGAGIGQHPHGVQEWQPAGPSRIPGPPGLPQGPR
jgi:hypothetical protein